MFTRYSKLLTVMLVGLLPTTGVLFSQTENVETSLAALRSQVAQQAEVIAALQVQLAAQADTLNALEATLTAVPSTVAPSASYTTTPSAPTTTPSRVEMERSAPSVTSKYDLRFYGYIKLDAAYDSRRSQGNLAFYARPGDGPEVDDELSITARQTRFGLEATAPEIGGGSVAGTLEMDFYGANTSDNKAGLRLYRAFATWDHGDWALEAGQNGEAFLTVAPATINFGALLDVGRLGYRRPQLRLERRSEVGDSTLISRVALARSMGSDLDGMGQNDGSDAAIPTVQGALILKGNWWNDREGLLSISGLAGEETVDGSGDVSSWAGVLAAQLPLGDLWTLRASVWTGSNLDTYYGGIGQGINPVTFDGIGATGGFVQFCFMPGDWKLHGTYSFDDPDDDDLNPGMRGRNTAWTFSGLYTIDSALTFGLEYTHLTTDYVDDGSYTNNRIQGTVIYKF